MKRYAAKRLSRKKAEYDFSGAERGEYARRYKQGTNAVVLEADVGEGIPGCQGGEQFLARAGRDHQAPGTMAAGK
jgi:hypothetical protein